MRETGECSDVCGDADVDFLDGELCCGGGDADVAGEGEVEGEAEGDAVEDCYDGCEIYVSQITLKLIFFDVHSKQ